jgi:hypothetical protein
VPNYRIDKSGWESYLWNICKTDPVLRSVYANDEWSYYTYLDY